MSTEDVLNHHLQSFGSGDVDETMKDYTDDSVLITPDGVLRGLDELRAAFETFYGGLFRPGTYEFEMDRIEVEGEVAFIVWHSSNEGAEVPLGTDTFLIRDGKIAVQTFAAKIETRSER
jgi:ketosteroid isomerase-like protein